MHSLRFRTGAWPRAARDCMAVLLAAAGLLLAAQPSAAQSGGKEMVAVMKMQGVGANETETEAITDRMREVLLKTGRFTMVDRSQMEAILNEQALQQHTCAEEECAVAAGRILGVSKIVTGKVVKFSDSAWQVSALMVDVQTAETVSADSVRHQGDVFSLLDHQVPLLGDRLVSTGSAAAPVTAPAAAPSRAAPPAAAGPLTTLRGEWGEGPALRVGRSGHAAVVVDGGVFVIGGEDERGQPLASVEVLLPGASAWVEAPPLPTPRTNAAAAVLDGQVYVMGGRTERKPTDRVDVLTPGGGWRAAPPLPSAREGAVAATLDGRIYLVGGKDAEGNSLDQVLTLAPDSGAWQLAAPLRDGRAFATVQAAADRLYVFGGRRSGSGLSLFGAALVKSVEMYRPQANRWERVAELPSALSHLASARVGRGIYLFGGFSGSAVLMSPQSSYWLFSLERGDWGDWTQPPASSGGLSAEMGVEAGDRVRHAAVVLPDRVLLIGGEPHHRRRVNDVR